jgi:hypothetical protein
VKTGDVEEALRCSAPTARAILETLDKLGVGQFVNPGPPVEANFSLTDDLEWLLEPIEKELTPCEPAIENDRMPCNENGRRFSDEQITRLGTMSFDELREFEEAP